MLGFQINSCGSIDFLFYLAIIYDFSCSWLKLKLLLKLLSLRIESFTTAYISIGLNSSKSFV